MARSRRGSRCCLKFSGVLVVVLAVVFGGLNLRLKTKQFVFDPDELTDMVKVALNETKGQAVNNTLTLVEARLRDRYSTHILPQTQTRWIFVNCGGWMGAMYILHASLTEYVMFFGTGIDTSGHSGRYLAEIYDTVVSGHMRQWKEGGMEVKEYDIGETVYHGYGEVTGVQWTSGTIMVEYAHGLIPTTLLFALADTFFSTTDLYVFYDTLSIYAYALGRELLQGNI